MWRGGAGCGGVGLDEEGWGWMSEHTVTHACSTDTTDQWDESPVFPDEVINVFRMYSQQQKIGSAKCDMVMTNQDAPPPFA